ncbi:MAG: hypothetical protein F6K19_34340 [Cyanothece sp. SIO1E1]|nr:hypothetical protein [Cyanothece sp. SIO1E1]
MSVNVTGPDRLKACKVLHCDLDTTLVEVRKMKDRMPGIVYTGAHKEMEWLCSRLQQFDFDASIRCIEEDGGMRLLDISLAETIDMEN